MSTHQLPLESTFMNIALEWAERSTCSGIIKVGCVLVNQFNQVIASGYTGSPRHFPECDQVGCDDDGHDHRVIHAEENALLQAAYTGISTMDTRLFVNHLPCYRCSLRLVQAGIYEVVYLFDYGNVQKTIDTFMTGRVTVRKLRSNHGK